MKNRLITVEHALYLAAFLVAAGIRFIGLGDAPLSDQEAVLALQSLDISRGIPAILGSQPFLALWNGVIFFLTDATNWTARFIPAMAGSILAVAPLFYRKYLGRRPALILAFGWAVSPALVAASCQLDSLVVAAAAIILAGGLFLNRRFAAAGILAGLAFLSGVSFWLAVSILLFVFLWGWLWKLPNTPMTNAGDLPGNEETPEVGKKKNFLQAGTGFIATVILAGSLFLIRPVGLSSAASSLVSFLTGWSGVGGTKFVLLVTGLVVCETLALFLGIWALICGQRHKDKVEMLLGRFFIAGLLLVFIYPSHRVIDLALVMIPLWALAARQINRWFTSWTEERLPSFMLAALILILGVFGWINAAGIPATQLVGGDTMLRWVSFAGAVILCIFMTMLVAWGWAPRVGIFGFRAGISLFLLVFLGFNSWSAAGLGRQPSTNLWRIPPYIQDADLLSKTIDEFSIWNAKNRLTLDITVIDFDSPALKWLLRNHEKVTYATGMLPDQRPSLVITSDRKDLPAATPYTGQDLVWNQTPAWGLFLPVEWFQWALYRDVPLDRENIVLWVRSDLFAGANQEGLTPSQP